MNASRHRIARLSNGSITEDGKYFCFDMETNDSGPLPMALAIDDVGALVSYIVTGATRGCQFLGIDAKPADDAEVPIEAIPMLGLGFAQQPDRSGFQLVVKLQGFWMSFQVDSSQMGAMAETMATIARLLSTTGKPQ